MHNTKSCKAHWFFKRLFQTDPEKKNSVFHQNVKKIAIHVERINLQSLSHADFLKQFLTMSYVNLAYDIAKKVMLEMSLIITVKWR